MDVLLWVQIWFVGRKRWKELQERLFDTRNLKASKYKSREGNRSVKGIKGLIQKKWERKENTEEESAKGKKH